MKKNNFICTDIHTHIGQFEQTYYDYHDVFSALKNNGIVSTTFAYLTPLFTKSEPAIEFYKAVTEELKDALKYANQIGLEVNALYWIDPVVISGGISIESIMKEFNYKGFAIHSFLNDWNLSKEENVRLLNEVFEYSKSYNYEIFIHTGCSERDNPRLFEKWFADFPEVKVHLAHCKDSIPIIDLFSKYANLVGDTAFCPQESYEAICNAGFKDRMLFGTDFPISHWYQHYRDGNFPLDEKSLTESYAQSLSEYKKYYKNK